MTLVNKTTVLALHIYHEALQQIIVLLRLLEMLVDKLEELTILRLFCKNILSLIYVTYIIYNKIYMSLAYIIVYYNILDCK